MIDEENRMNDEDRRKFEALLREFEPRRPRALPAAEDAWRWWPRLAAAAALILALGAASLWIGMRHSQTRNNDLQQPITNIPVAAASQHPPMSTLALTRAALENSPEFDKEINSRAQRDLPGFNRKESMLRVLAKE
jgi:hypothetical protein